MSPKNSRRSFQLCDTGYVIVEFADSFFRGEAEILERQRQIYSKLNRARRRRTGRRIEEIVFNCLV